MARKNKNGISPAGKLAILLVLFGLPLMFALSSWGLGKVYDIAPWALIVILIIVATVYTAYTAGLLYKFYEVPAPIVRFIPCVCECSLIDLKYRKIAYIFYVLSAIFLGATQLPYSVLGKIGVDFATHAPMYFLLLGAVFMLVVQVVKGIGLIGCMKDIGADWNKQTHADVGVLSKFMVLCFVPFVRVMALYALNKPLSTLVSFMGVTQSDSDQDNGFVDEDEEEDDEDDEDDDE